MKGTKRSLFLSIISLILCFSMLLGSTLAWFTDSAVSAYNKIVAGTLKVDLELLDEESGEWKSLKNNHDPIFDYEYWEPSYTDVKILKVENEGNLALKWKAALVSENGLSKLAEVIDVYIYTSNTEIGYPANRSLADYRRVGTLKQFVNTVGSPTNGSLAPESATYIGIALKMQKKAGNEYMGMDLGGEFDIMILATQDASESDSFGNNYDAEATFPEIVGGSISTTVNTAGNVTSSSASMSGKGMAADIPAGVTVKDGVSKLTLTVMEKEYSESNVVVDDGQLLRPLDVHMNGVSENNTVPMRITVEKAMKPGMNMGNYTLVHVENGVSNHMTLVASIDELDAHNEYYYDPITGDVVLCMATFSEVAFVADGINVWKGNIANSFAGGDGSAENPYLIANADQLAYLNEVISNDNANYANKHYKLVADINLGGEENAYNGIIFYPIGYNKAGVDVATVDVDTAPEFIGFDEDPDYARGSVSAAEADGTAVWYTYGGAFKGVFDGNGNTIKNVYQNTWLMKGDYEGDKHYWNDAMGIFGYVYGGTVKNLTVDNFTSDGEFTPTGVIAAYAAEAIFENIAIKNSNPRVYNTGNGGIVGVGGNSSDTSDKKLIFTNITVDNSNKISALWGSWDVACGGLMGMFRGNGRVHFENCHVGAQIDVYNDVCGNYQYYWYRYAGMVIGSIRGRNTVVDGYTVPNMAGITANNCTVHFGTWNDYYYCELVANSLASYTHDHQFSRLTQIKSLDEIKDGDTWTKAGNFLLINGSEKTCYHIVNKDGVLTQHNHADAGTEVVNGQTVLKEDNQIIYLPFNQLFQGDGWGVKHIGFRNDGELDFEGIKILDRDEANSIDKFEALINGDSFETETTLTLGQIFKSIASVNTQTLKVFVSPVGEESTVSAVYTPNTSDWTLGTLTFNGVGAAKIVITDYTYCKETTASVIIEKHEHSYHAVVTSPTCTTAGYTTYTCDCGYSYVANEVEALGHNYSTNETAPTCTEAGYTTYTCTCGYSYVEEVEALGHSYNAVVTPPTCIAGGYTTYTCGVCKYSYVDNHVDTIAHTYSTVVTAPTCTEGGYTTHTCQCGDTYIDNETEALGHSYNAVVTAPTCTEGGYTTHTCQCGDTYIDNETEALGHSYNAVVTAPTCTEKGYTTYTCDCGDSYVADEVNALGHITKKFTGDFLYRVGNKNAVQLSSLFNVEKRNVEFGCENVSGNASVAVNGTSLQFSGTGVVKVTISADCTCQECALELQLEVVDAVNATSATSATKNNVVLLNDVGLYTIEVSNGYTLYGNGFKMTAKSDPMYDTMRAGFVTLDNGTLDNVQIICPNFSFAIIYNSQIKDSGNTAKPSDGSNDARGNVRSAVMATGNSKIINSYVHGGRAAIFLRAGNLIIEDSTISGGAAANIHALSAQSLTLRDATLIQKPFTDDVHNTGKTLMGFSVLLECGEDGYSTPVILEGTLIQDAWINEEYVQYTPSSASSIVNTALGKTEYLHDLDGDGKNESLNLGFTYIPQTTGGSTNANVTDNRTNKAAVPYAAVDVGTMLASAKVFSYKNTNGTSDKFKNVDDYVASAQGATAPTVSFTDTNADRVFETKFDANDARWESTLTIDLKSNYDFSFDNLLVQKHGGKLSYTVKTPDGTEIDISKKITLSSTGVRDYVLTVTDGDATHTIYFSIAATKTEIPAPETATTTGGTPLLVVKSKNSDWTVGIPALEGMKIKYYTDAGEVILDLATLTPNSVGKQNGTNNYWETTKDGYKLKVTCGVIHDTKSVYGMPVVVDNNGTKQMYFTISSTNGYVSTGTSARSVTLTYEFTDPNGKTLTFTKNYNVKYADYKDVAQYNYSDFVKGTLTDTLKTSSTECVTPDTLITLANGAQVRVDSLTGSEELLVWNMETGKLDKAPIMFVDSEEMAEFEVIKLYFSDGTVVEVIGEHGFWDYDLNRYVYLDKDATDYIGHSFAKQNGDALETVQLVDVVIETRVTEAWSPVTAGHLCYFVNGMLSMPGGVGGLFNIFEVDAETMTYDYEAMQRDIETYGLFTYEEMNAICPLSEEMFNAAGGAYLKISIGKGNLTEEELFNMINRYSKYI